MAEDYDCITSKFRDKWQKTKTVSHLNLGTNGRRLRLFHMAKRMYQLNSGTKRQKESITVQFRNKWNKTKSISHINSVGTRRSSLKGQERAIVNGTNTRSVSKAT